MTRVQKVAEITNLSEQRAKITARMVLLERMLEEDTYQTEEEMKMCESIAKMLTPKTPKSAKAPPPDEEEEEMEEGEHYPYPHDEEELEIEPEPEPPKRVAKKPTKSTKR